MRSLPRRYQAEPPEPRLNYEGDVEDLPIRKAAHAALHGPWPPALTQSVLAYWDTRAGDWTENMGPAHTVPLRDALERLEGPPPRTVVEIGAGTGLGTRTAAAVLPRARILATDLSAAMLAAARREGTQTPMAAMDAQSLALGDGVADLVILFNAYLFPDETRRVLAPGGAVLGVWTLGPATPIYVTAAQAEEALGGEATVAEAAWGSWWRVSPQVNPRTGGSRRP
jgi:SAM-dependent methyltransferase